MFEELSVIMNLFVNLQVFLELQLQLQVRLEHQVLVQQLQLQEDYLEPLLHKAQAYLEIKQLNLQVCRSVVMHQHHIITNFAKRTA